MAEQKIVDGDYYIICDNGAGNLNIIANVDITGTLTYSNIVTVNAAFFTVAESNPGTIIDMGMLAQTGPTTFAGLRYDVPTETWQVSNNVNSAGVPITPYTPLLTTSSNLANPNIGNASGINLTLSGYLQTATHITTGNSVVSGWSNVGNLNSLGVVQAPNAVFTGADIGFVNAGTVNAASSISAAGQITGSDVIAHGVVSGTIINAAGNVNAADASITGNITAGQFIGDGGLLSNINASNIFGGYSNANVAAFLPTYSGSLTANTISTSSNITADYYFGNVSQCTGFPTLDNYSNANVAAFLPTYTGTVTASVISTTGDITADHFVGNGALLTGLPAGYSNANVAAFLPTYTGTVTASVISTTGDITADHFVGNGALLTGLPAGYSNADAAAFLVNLGSNNISTGGTVTGANIIGEGGNLSNIQWANISNTPTFYANSNVAAYLPIYDGNILSDTLTGNVVNTANIYSSSVTLNNITKALSLSNAMTAFVPATLQLTDSVAAVNFNWVLKSSSGDAVSTGKGFAAANTTSVSVTYYGNSSVGTGLGSIAVSGNSSSLTFTASAGTVSGTFILMVTEYLS